MGNRKGTPNGLPSRAFSRFMAALLLSVFMVGTSVAAEMALLPFADLSVGPNSVDLPFTQEFRTELERQGVKLVPQEEVYRFLAENRVRVSGYLDAFLAIKMGRALGCSHILLGTVTERREGRDPAFGFVLTLLDASAGVPVWSVVRGTSLSEHVRVLGLDEPKTVRDIRDPLIVRTIREIPRHFNSSPARLVPTYKVSDFQIYPKFLQGNAPVNCRLEMDFLDTPPSQVCLEYASGASACLSPAGGDGRFAGHFPAPEEGGTYEVDLVLRWGEDGSSERLEALAAFEVINDSPLLEMAFNNGTQVEEIPVFRSHLIVSPRLREIARVERWSVEVHDEDGKLVLLEEQEGALPERLVWDGKDAKKRKLRDGVYRLSLSVWDPAGNQGQVSRNVAVRTSVAGLHISTLEEDGQIYLCIQREQDESAPVVSWSLHAASPDGRSLVEQKGSRLPAKLKIRGEEKGVLLVSLEAQDQLGNRVSVNHQEVSLPTNEEEQKDAEDFSFAAFGWDTEFEDL